MPAVSSISCSYLDASHGSATMVTSWGTLVFSVVIAGAVWALTVTQNSVTKASTSFTSPLNSTVESWTQTVVQNLCIAGATNAMQYALHIFSSNPLSFGVYIADLGQTIPANWWIPA